MARIGIVTVTLKNWAKYNPRADRTNHVWFRFQNSYFDDPEIYELEPDTQRIHILCCCEASKANSDTFKISVRQAADRLKLSEGIVLANLTELVERGLIDGQLPDNRRQSPGESRTDAGQQPSLVLTTDRQTDITIQTDKGVTAETAAPAAQSPPRRGRPKKKAETPEGQRHFGLLVGAYVTLFKAKYNGATPDTGPVPIACLKRVFAANGLERARNLLETFFQVEDAWIKKRHHDMATFEKCINQLSVALANGHEMGQINWRQVQGAPQLGGADEIPRISDGDASLG